MLEGSVSYENLDEFQDAVESLEHTEQGYAPSNLSSTSMTEVLLPRDMQRQDSPFTTEQHLQDRLQAGSGAQATSAEGSRKDYALHRAAFSGTSTDVWELMRGLSEEEMAALDPQGNTALHVAVLKKRVPIILALLDAGFPISTKNGHQWSALEEATALKDKEMVKLLHAREVASLKAELKAKKEVTLQALNEIPDCAFQIKWELKSPVLGMLLRKYAPSDTYEVWKSGSKMRVDGTMMGLDVKRTGILPVWKKGHFSLICDGSRTPASMLLLDHEKRKYWDLYAEKKKNRPSLDEEASLIISDGAVKTKMKASEKYFKPVKGWFGYETTEKIEGWKTKVYEASGKIMAITIRKKAFVVPEKASWDDYLALSAPQDVVKEEAVDLTSMDLMSTKTPTPAQETDEEEVKKRKQPRKITGKCWMAENFPMSLKNLLPLLDVIGNANKHIARIGNFLQKYGNKDLFPVKVQIPLFYTIYALVSFGKFSPLDQCETAAARTPAYYELPANYELREFNDGPQRRRSKSLDRTNEPPRASSLEVQGSDAEILAQMGL